MRDRILAASIESLRREGLKFSVDMLAQELKISKKTVYKYFPTKEALALALYETYYDGALGTAARLGGKDADGRTRLALLRLYYDAKRMTRAEIFNKYKLNGIVFSYISERHEALWEAVYAGLCVDRGAEPETEKRIFRILADGVCEKLCADETLSEPVLERLVKLL
ncbi:MAG: TetR/AcrR family transcriptional regulator [Eubacteriales bacterium]